MESKVLLIGIIKLDKFKGGVEVENLNENFAIMFIRNNQYYPIALTEEQHLMIQTFAKSLFASTGNKKLILVDQPFGTAANLATKKD